MYTAAAINGAFAETILHGKTESQIVLGLVSRIIGARYVGFGLKAQIHAANRGRVATHASLRSGTRAADRSDAGSPCHQTKRILRHQLGEPCKGDGAPWSLCTSLPRLAVENEVAAGTLSTIPVSEFMIGPPNQRPVDKNDGSFRQILSTGVLHLRAEWPVTVAGGQSLCGCNCCFLSAVSPVIGGTVRYARNQSLSETLPASPATGQRPNGSNDAETYLDWFPVAPAGAAPC
jgi:hypothetical protein